LKETEFPPILEKGFKDISIKDLDKYFVEPFSGSVTRKNITKEFINYLDEFYKLSVNSEVWIDGSYATLDPEPNDIDAVFFFDYLLINSLENDKKKLFDKLFFERKLIMNLYKIDIFAADINSIEDKEEWIKSFGFNYDKSKEKGIFRIILSKEMI
jgi:hypothetical protein